MAVVQGNKALASDYNTLKDEINKWFGDSDGSMTFGAANQDYGWGGLNASAISAGQLMTAAQMNALVDRCNIGDNVTNTPGLSQIVAGNQITAAEFNGIGSNSNIISLSRLDPQPSVLSLNSGGSSARSSTWSAAVNATFRYTFSDFAHARYFFNSGGAFNLSGTITGYSTGTGWDGAGFNEIFTNMGTILMNYTRTTQSGSGGSTTSIGYYDLTTSYQTIFSQTGSGAYTDATLGIEARRSASGNYVEIRVTLTPGSGRSVDGTTTLTTQFRKLINQTSGTASLTIPSPSYSLIDAL